MSSFTSGDGELYTWGRAGPRLGYEVGEGKQTSPRLVESLVSHKVEKVDCGLEFTIGECFLS